MPPEHIELLLRGLEVLAWPLVVLVLVLVFKAKIRDVLGRMRKGKVFGQELELEERLEKVQDQVSSVQRLALGLVSVDAETVAKMGRIVGEREHIQWMLARRADIQQILIREKATEAEIRKRVGAIDKMLVRDLASNLRHSVEQCLKKRDSRDGKVDPSELVSLLASLHEGANSIADVQAWLDSHNLRSRQDAASVRDAFDDLVGLRHFGVLQ